LCRLGSSKTKTKWGLGRLSPWMWNLSPSKVTLILGELGSCRLPLGCLNRRKRMNQSLRTLNELSARTSHWKRSPVNRHPLARRRRSLPITPKIHSVPPEKPLSNCTPFTDRTSDSHYISIRPGGNSSVITSLSLSFREISFSSLLHATAVSPESPQGSPRLGHRRYVKSISDRTVRIFV